MKKNIIYIISTSIVLLILIYFSFYNRHISSTFSNNINENTLLVHFIDVGQGDSILIQTFYKNILIDSGSNIYSRKLIHYIKKLNIKTLDYVIATHPHEDHIGSMDDIIKSFSIGEFYAPRVSSNTEDFVSMWRELSQKKKKINVANSGLVIVLDNYTYLKFLSPKLSYYDNLNNYSTVIKLQHDENSFLFTGDSEELIEKDLLTNTEEISSKVLKIGHHGSKTSTSKAFLTKINPNYAVISCGMGNDYGHPDKKVLDSLKSLNIRTLRTDQNGNIILSSNGKAISVFLEKK